MNRRTMLKTAAMLALPTLNPIQAETPSFYSGYVHLWWTDKHGIFVDDVGNKRLGIVCFDADLYKADPKACQDMLPKHTIILEVSEHARFMYNQVALRVSHPHFSGVPKGHPIAMAYFDKEGWIGDSGQAVGADE